MPSPMLGDSYTLDLESCLSHGFSMIRDTYHVLRYIELQPGAEISCKSLDFKPREEVILLFQLSDSTIFCFQMCFLLGNVYFS